MSRLLGVLLVLFTCLFIAQKTYAILFLPALVLIPIAKIVAIVIAGFSFPALGVGALFSKFFGKSLMWTLLSIVVLLLIIGLMITLFLMYTNPERPLF